jgi:hypothetical protein
MHALDLPFRKGIMSNKQKIHNLLKDGNWHSAYELNDLYGWKFASRISDLIKDGIEIEKRKHQLDKPELDYKLKDLTLF